MTFLRAYWRTIGIATFTALLAAAFVLLVVEGSGHWPLYLFFTVVAAVLTGLASHMEMEDAADARAFDQAKAEDDGERIPLRDIEQAWFWTEEWQAGEREAERDIRAGRVHRFDTSEAAIAWLTDEGAAQRRGAAAQRWGH